MILAQKAKISLRIKFIVLILGVMALILLVYIGLSSYNQQQRAEAEMLEKAEILAEELDAFWTFMEINEDRINTDSQGEYDFKGLYCVVAAKSVSSLFTEKSDYSIHYTNLKTRRPADSPDAFEAEAITSFIEKTAEEHFALTDYEGKQSFRYVKPLYITESCLKCHGQPAGDPDVFGFPKEGQALGDVAGAVSIIMPVDTYMQTIDSTRIQNILLFSVLLICCVAAIIWGVTKLVVRPLERLGVATKHIEEGNFDIDVENIGWRDEMNELSIHVSAMAKELSGFYEDLENKVTTRTAQLEEANEELAEQRMQLEHINEQLQKDNEYKSDYLATMSHELRTPLTSILAFTDMWEKENKQWGARDEVIVQEIKINGNILLSIVNNILEMSRVEAGRSKLNREEVDLVDIFGLVEHTVQPLADKKQLSVSFSVEKEVPLFEADWEKVRRITENLVSNAVKYTHRGGTIEVVGKKGTDEDILIQVTDDGVGIKEEDLDQIFNKFEQNSGSSYRRYNGTGLGLAVVRELVELHEGTIEVQSDYKQGSVFTVSLPAR